MQDGSNAAPPTVMVCVYGKPKKKKTSDAIAAFPNGLFIGVPSAIALVANNELGIQPAIHPNPPQTLPELVQMLEQLSANPETLKPYGALIIDDASHICKTSMLKWAEEAPTGRSGRKDRFFQYQQLNSHLLQLAGLSRHLGVHLAMTFHERPPGSNVDGVFCPGGPDVPSRNQTETLPSWCDINVRSMIDPSYPDPWFSSIYYCDPTDSEWVTGDRTGVCSEKTPGNLREVMNASASGYQLARFPGLEWQDDVAEEVAEQILLGRQSRDIAVEVMKNHSQYAQVHLRWACQDGIARGVLRAQQQKGLFDFDSAESRVSDASSLPPPPMVR
jgi:hypothetical protein